MAGRLDEILEALEEAVASGSSLALRLFEEGNLSYTRKDDGSPVSVADVQVEELIRERLERLLPEITVVGEESVSDAAGRLDDYIALDPIDGTSNYLRGTPFFAVTAAYLAGGLPSAGVVADPVHRRTFTAVRGGGAFREGERMKIGEGGEASALRFATVSLAGESLPRELQRGFLGAIAGSVHRLQALRSVALEVTGVAAGWVDATVFNRISVWDVAAACLIVEEAGGLWTALDGARPPFTDPRARYSVLAASNVRLHSEIRGLLAG